jgi:1,4-alpha-glucan branching enzyme
VLDWWMLDFPFHQGIQRLVKDLNHLYHASPALYTREFEHEGFEWIDCHDSSQSILSFVRRNGDEVMVVALNFTPVPRSGYRIGVPAAGHWREVFNSDSEYYGGGNLRNGGDALEAEEREWMNRLWSIEITLPPLAAVVLAPASDHFE